MATMRNETTKLKNGKRKTKLPTLTLTQVRTRVDAILADGDPESAHTADDVLREIVLRAISDGNIGHLNGRRMARECLRTKDIKRYYA